jgi:metal-responsive CopG/Arc/MetJ family transcriptional regulator
MVIWKELKKISLDLPIELLTHVDETAKAYYMSRAEYVRLVLHKAVAEHHKRQTEQLLKCSAAPEGLENDPRIWDVDDS